MGFRYGLWGETRTLRLRLLCKGFPTKPLCYGIAKIPVTPVKHLLTARSQAAGGGSPLNVGDFSRFWGGGGEGKEKKKNRGKKEFLVLFCIFTTNNREKPFLVACAGPDVSVACDMPTGKREATRGVSPN